MFSLRNKIKIPSKSSTVNTPNVVGVLCHPNPSEITHTLQWHQTVDVLCRNKMPTWCNRCFLFQILLLTQHVSGTTMPIIRSSRALYILLLPVVFGALVFKLSVWCGAEGYVSGLRAAAISNKICNKNHLLHLVGILFPHINDDARSKPHQICGCSIERIM